MTVANRLGESYSVTLSVELHNLTPQLDAAEIMTDPFLASNMQIEQSSTELPRSRMVVMNGQRIIQSKKGDDWEVVKVAKANGVKPGYYDLHMARPPSKQDAYEGVILHTDRLHIWQQVSKSAIVVHTVIDFDKIPEVGTSVRIKYDANYRAIVEVPTLKLDRSRSR